ncbi:MAG: TonB-dependent receptor [Tunicatimonas sp.]
MKTLLLSLFISLLTLTQALAQPRTQTVRGRIVDTQSEFPLAGVNVVVLDSDPLIGTATDLEGYFRLTDVPVGRQTLQVSFIGYGERTIPNVMVTTGKEVILNLSLEENVMMADEVVVTADAEKVATNNELTTVSARSFNLEETGRYAGSLNDPARMAANFAGVASNNDDRNDIVIRGNSPSGVLWRLDGINIPNPSHFGSVGASGGPVSMLNYNVLDKSDFLTGAFPAEYGNATAGVFDLQLRNGNSEKREYLGQIGFNGVEAGIEGPFSKKSRASYIVNYRYSTFGLLSNLGIDGGTGSAVPQYQDLTFKVNVPTEKAGRFTLFGIGGTSSIEFLGSEENVEELNGNLFSDENQDLYPEFSTGIVGLSHLYYFNSTTHYKLSLAASRQTDSFRIDSVDTENRNVIIPNQDGSIANNKYSAHLMANKKFNARNTISVGTILDLYDFDIQNRRLVPGDERVFRDIVGQSLLTQVYAQWQHRFNDRLTLNTGLNYQHFEVSDSRSLGPRAGLSYELNDRQTIGLGYGFHSQIQPVEVYFTQSELADGSTVLSNQNLDFVNSQHLVLSYDHLLSQNLRMKVEAYYQDITDAGVESTPSSFSLLNVGAEFGTPDEDFLVNEGTGRNLGVELTLERFFSKGYYFLWTTSLFDAQYEGSDGIERSTAFDGGYVVNLLGGKEFEVGKKGNTLNIDLKFTASGGNRFTPIDFERSAELGYEVRQDNRAYSEAIDDYLRADVKISYRINAKRATYEFGVDFRNVTNNENEFSRTYNARTNTIQTQNQIGFNPIPQFRVTF